MLLGSIGTLIERLRGEGEYLLLVKAAADMWTTTPWYPVDSFCVGLPLFVP